MTNQAPRWAQALVAALALALIIAVLPTNSIAQALTRINAVSINGVAWLTGAGGTGTGSPRVTEANDSQLSAGVGAVGDAAATAGGTGSLTAKTRLMTTLLDSIKTAVESANSQDVPHDDPDAGTPVKIGCKALSLGSNPTAVGNDDRTNIYCTRSGQQFVLNGHPNMQSIEVEVEDADNGLTNAAVVSVSTGSIVVVTGAYVACDSDNTDDINVKVGFGTATLTASSEAGAAEIFFRHPGVPAGGGLNRSGLFAIGDDDEDVRVTMADPAGGSCVVGIDYFTVAG